MNIRPFDEGDEEAAARFYASLGYVEDSVVSYGKRFDDDDSPE